jgi:hypothetical protein
MDVDFHPTNSNLAVAAGHEGRAWYSANGGASFTEATGLPSVANAFRRVETAYAPSSPNIVYASIDLAGGSLYRSIDGGVSYSLVFNGSPDYLGSQGWYDNALFVDPTNPDFVIVGGIDLYRSTNGGVSFTPLSTWWAWPNSAHADHHTIVAVPGFNGTTNAAAFFGNDGGIYGTTNIYTVGNNATAPYTNGWQAYNNNLAITQFYGAAAHPGTGKVMGGTQDNGTLTYTTAGGTEGWVFEFGGDGGWSAIDQTDANYCYGEYVFLRIHRSSNGCGQGSGNYIYGGLTDAVSGFANFIAPFILDPNNQSRLLAGGRSLWRTDNAKAATVAWSAIKAPTTGNSNISAIAVHDGNADLIWVGHNNGELYKSMNGTAAAPTWTLMDAGLPNRVVTRVAVDRTNPLIVYVTFGGYASDNIWKSVNGGTSWTNVHGILPAAPIRSIVLNPTSQDWLYIGTEVGIFTSESGGASWFLPHDGPANVSVDEVFFAGTTLYAATHGRGVYKAEIGAGPPGGVSLISPNTYTGTTTPTYRWNANAASTWYQLQVNDASGVKILQWYTAAQAGCGTGAGVCQVTPATSLLAGHASWRVQTWNLRGYGPWSALQAFHTGYPTAEIAQTWPVPDTLPGHTAPLWLQVRNTGTLALPSGSQAWYLVSGPGISAYVGFVNVEGLAPGAAAWYRLNWDVPVPRTAGVHTYVGRVWSATFGRWLGNPSAGRNFNVLAPPAQAARILATWRVDGAMPGGTARLWALVSNSGTSALDARVWFNVGTVGWIGYATISGLAPGAQQWYFVDWSIPANRPPGLHAYYAQVWNTAGNVPYSTASAWQGFTVGFNSQFNTDLGGWSPVTGVWGLTSSAYLYTAGGDNQFATVQYPSVDFTNVEFTARLWRNGDNSWYQGLYLRGTPTASFWSDGYLFLYTRNGSYSVWKGVSGSYTAIQNWTSSSALVQGSAWNVLRVRASGGDLSLSINGTAVWTGTDSTFSTGKVGIAAFRPAGDTGFGFWVDYATLGGYGVPEPNRERQSARPLADLVSPEQQTLNEEANRTSGRSYQVIPPPPQGRGRSRE